MFDEVFATLLVCLLCRLLGSRVQLNRAIHYRPFGTPTQGIQTVTEILALAIHPVNIVEGLLARIR